MRILFVAAETMEFRGIEARAAGLRREAVPVDWARSGRFGGHEVLLAANGAGWKRAGAAAKAGIEVFRPEAVVSTGFCGALDERLEVADIVVATEVRNGRSCYATRRPRELTSTAGGGHKTIACPTVSVDRVVQTKEEKRRLRETGAGAVEMEAAAVAQSAAARDLPFYCVRVVTDLAGETLANDFNAALREDGHFDTMNILKGALHHPSARIPELLRLRRRTIRAALSLGAFFAECGF